MTNKTERKMRVKVISAPAGAYLTAGIEYAATQSRKGGDWNLVRDTGSGTYTRWYTFTQAVRSGAFELVGMSREDFLCGIGSPWKAHALRAAS
jgi:hypothetical protein